MLVEVLLVGLGGSLGATVRYLVSQWAATRFGTTFPVGTLAANVAGSLLLGLIVVRAGTLTPAAPVYLLLTVGLCGGFTTFSTFAYETVALATSGAHRRAVLNAIASLVLSLVAAAAGGWLAVVLWPHPGG